MTFQEGSAPTFLISLQAGGVGLTFTDADSDILYDPWWNPAAERHAMERTHRIGQTRKVFVYQLAAGGSVEERIKGVHPAGLSFGDCFAYVSAKSHDAPLLFVGEDFSKTDIASVLEK